MQAATGPTTKLVRDIYIVKADRNWYSTRSDASQRDGRYEFLGQGNSSACLYCNGSYVDVPLVKTTLAEQFVQLPNDVQLQAVQFYVWYRTITSNLPMRLSDLMAGYASPQDKLVTELANADREVKATFMWLWRLLEHARLKGALDHEILLVSSTRLF